jgi:hypothetical protein
MYIYRVMLHVWLFVSIDSARSLPVQSPRPPRYARPPRARRGPRARARTRPRARRRLRRAVHRVRGLARRRTELGARAWRVVRARGLGEGQYTRLKSFAAQRASPASEVATTAAACARGTELAAFLRFDLHGGDRVAAVRRRPCRACCCPSSASISSCATISAFATAPSASTSPSGVTSSRELLQREQHERLLRLDLATVA